MGVYGSRRLDVKDKSKDKLYFISLNLVKNKHEKLINWIKESANKNEQSLSSFCILMLKKCMERQNDKKDGNSI